MLIHAAAFNLALIMRSRHGYGTPRGVQGLTAAAAALAGGAASGLAAPSTAKIACILGPPRVSSKFVGMSW